MTARDGGGGGAEAGGSVSPDRIFELATGFMAAKHLFAASEVGLFEALAAGPATLDELARRAGLPRRMARISADAMVALGLVERDGERYRNGAAAAAFLSGQGPADLRPFLRFWNAISYPAWTALADTLRAGRATPPELDETGQALFSAGVESIQAGPAAALAEVYDFGVHRRLLDVAGGTGSWSAAVVRRHPHMRATVVDLPAVAPIARKRLAEVGLADRIAVVAGDVMSDPLPGGHDVVLLANIVHYFSPEKNAALLRHLRDAVDDGARVLLADFWTDPSHTHPLMAALMAGEFAVLIEEGDVYSAEEARSWLDETGWRFVEQRPLAGPVSVVVGEATA
jgi:ubiquinone/menaquinone biosynthesis C-methylase UbiE